MIFHHSLNILTHENLERYSQMKIKNAPQPARLSSRSAKAELITGAWVYLPAHTYFFVFFKDKLYWILNKRNTFGVFFCPSASDMEHHT